MFRFFLIVHNHYNPSHTLLYSLLMRYLFPSHCYCLKTHQCLLLFQDIRLHFSVLLSLLVQVYSYFHHYFQAVRNSYNPTHILFRLPLVPMYALLLLLLLLYLLNIDFPTLRLLLAVPLFCLHHSLIPAVHNCYSPMTILFRLFLRQNYYNILQLLRLLLSNQCFRLRFLLLQVMKN